MARPLRDWVNILQNKGMRIQTMWEISVTTGYSDVDTKLSNITLYADGFTVPNRKQEFAEVPFKGYPLLVPSKMTMGNEHSLTIRCDINGDVRRLFLKWMNYITDASITTGSHMGGEKRIPKNSYIRAQMLGMDMQTVLETYKLIGCSIEEVGDLKMSHADAAVATFDVKIRSQYWEVEKATGDFPEQK